MIKVNDVVEVLPNPVYSSLVAMKGFVAQKIAKNTSLVIFPSICKHFYADTLESFSSRLWYIPDKYLKIIDSPEDNRMGALEDHVQSLEDDLAIARAALSISEELRDKQFDVIKSMQEEIDKMKAKTYYTRDNKGYEEGYNNGTDHPPFGI